LHASKCQREEKPVIIVTGVRQFVKLRPPHIRNSKNPAQIAKKCPSIPHFISNKNPAIIAMAYRIDKHVLRQSKEKIAAELEYKIPPMIRTGGCVLGLDHRVPNGTPLSHYRFCIQKAWEIMERNLEGLQGI